MCKKYDLSDLPQKFHISNVSNTVSIYMYISINLFTKLKKETPQLFAQH